MRLRIVIVRRLAEALLLLTTLLVASAILDPGDPVAMGATRSSTSSHQTWTYSSFTGAGLHVRFEHPAAWQSQLRPLGLHYSATLGFLANFHLNQFCGSPSPTSYRCIWADLGPFPPDGILMEFGTGGYGPGPMTQKELLGSGHRVTVGGHTARRQLGSGVGCLGTGAQSSVIYRVTDGQAQGIFSIDFCLRGPYRKSMQTQIDRVIRSFRITPGPPGVGVQPS